MELDAYWQSLRAHGMDSAQIRRLDEFARPQGPLSYNGFGGAVVPCMIRRFFPDGHLEAIGDDDLARYFDGDYNTMRWRLTKSRDGVVGQFFQVNRYPSAEIFRLPNWGWLMHSQWVVHCFPAGLMGGLHHIT